MKYIHEAGQQLVVEIQHWLYFSPPEEIRQVRGYVEPNPCNDMAMHESGRAHSQCPDWCEGCSCPIGRAPCGHCTDHYPLDEG